MSIFIPFISAKDVKARYPGQWRVTNGDWGYFATKVFGPYICQALSLRGQQTRWRMKEVSVKIDKDDEFVKVYKTVSAGRALNNMEAIRHMEENRLPALLSAYQYRIDRQKVREQVIENVG